MNRAYLWLLPCFIFVAFICILVVDARKRTLLETDIRNITEVLTKHIYVSSYPVDITYLDTISPVFVYRYPEFSCSVCYQEDLELLRSFKNEIGVDHICILPAYRESRNNEILLRNELTGFDFINVESDIPLFEIDGVIQRYFAVYEKGKGFKMMFFPDRKQTELTKYYFGKVKAKYFPAE